MLTSQYLRYIIEPYAKDKPYPLIRGADPSRYLTITTEPTSHKEGHPIVLYILGSSCMDLLIAQGSHKGDFVAADWAHFFWIPAPQIEGHYDEIRASMKGGGM